MMSRSVQNVHSQTKPNQTEIGKDHLLMPSHPLRTEINHKDDEDNQNKHKNEKNNKGDNNGPLLQQRGEDRSVVK